MGEEKNILIQLQNEKESVTKCIDSRGSTLTHLESDCQQKAATINETFDALIESLKDRKSALLNSLNSNVLSTKTDTLKQMESLKQYQQKLTGLDSKYQSLINPKTQTTNNDDEKQQAKTINKEQRKEQILSISDEFNSSYSDIKIAADIRLTFNTKELQTMINNFGSIRMANADDPEYDKERMSSFIDNNLELLLAEIPVKKLYHWALKSDNNFGWKPRCQRTVIYFYQNKKSYKVRMIIKENESDNFLMNQWVAIKELQEKNGDKLVWLWSSFDASIASEEGDDAKGFTKWCAKFFDDIAFERFEDQYNQARKINIQVLDNEAKLEKNKKVKRERMNAMKKEQEIQSIYDEEAEYYENDERLCFEMDVWKTYLWGKDASGKGSWRSYADKSVMQFFESREKKKVRIVLRENESKDLKLNHWIPTDCSLKSRGDQMWEWQVYDDLASKFLKNSTLKLATVCATFIDKKDTEKYKELFEKYQK